MRYRISFIMLLLFVLPSVSAVAQKHNINRDARQIYKLPFKGGQDESSGRKYPPLTEYLQLDDWKFVGSTDTNHYVRDSASPVWQAISPIVFNGQRDKAYFYSSIWYNDDQTWGPALNLFARDKKGWKLVSLGLTPID